jgi:hypothetical protein
MRIILGTIILGFALVACQPSCNEAAQNAVAAARDFTDCMGPAGVGCKTRGLEALSVVRTAKRTCEAGKGKDAGETLYRLNRIERMLEQMIDR